MARIGGIPFFGGAWHLSILDSWNHIFEPWQIALFGNYSTWETENPHVEDLFDSYRNPWFSGSARHPIFRAMPRTILGWRSASRFLSLASAIPLRNWRANVPLRELASNGARWDIDLGQ